MLKRSASTLSFHSRECTAQLMLFCSTDMGFTFLPWAGGEEPLWKGCLCPHPWATTSQGQGQSAHTTALPGWPRVLDNGGRHSGCHGGVAVPHASIPTQLEALSWAYSCTVGVLSWLFQEEDSEEMSPRFCRDTHSTGGCSQGWWAVTCMRVPQHVCVSLLPREQLTPLARARSLEPSPPSHPGTSAAA